MLLRENKFIGNVFTVLLSIYLVLIFFLSKSGNTIFDNLHIALDSSNGMLSLVFGIFLWTTVYLQRTESLRGYLAVSFFFASLLEIFHALVGVEWIGNFSWITEVNLYLRPATWPPSTYFLPLALLGAIWCGEIRKKPTLVAFTLGLFIGLVLLYLLFFQLPSYKDIHFMGIHRPFQIPVLALLAVAGYAFWKRLAQDPLFEAFIYCMFFLFLSDFLMLFSTSPHEKWAMTAHLGKFFGYLSLHLAMMGLAVEDLKARKRAEEILKEEKERLNVTLQSIGDGVITTNTQGKVALINPVAESLTGWGRNEAQGKPISEVFHIINEQSRVLCENPVAKVLAEKKIVALANHTMLVSKDGTERSIADSGAPILNINGEIIGVVLVFRDVTEKKRMEEDQLKSMKLESIGLLAGGIAHDFNNILTAILGNISLAQLELDSNMLVSQYLNETEKATLRAKELASQLLAFTKGGAPQKKVASIQPILEESAKFALTGSNIEYQFHFSDNLWAVDIDQGQISQLVHNIVINAQQAMSEGGEVILSAENMKIDEKKGRNLILNPGNYVQISFRDNGKGIPENLRDKIFDPFFTTKERGSGLGLFSSFSIAKNHDGTIRVDSKVGLGTTFYVYLPALVDKRPEDETKEEGIIFGTGKILVMDDEEIVRKMIGPMLRKLGYEVEFATGGEEALEIYRSAKERNTPFRAVILDLTIPGGKGGKQTVQELLVYDPNVRVIVSSGYSNDPVMSSYQKFGFKGRISKPYRIQELSRSLFDLLDKKQG